MLYMYCGFLKKKNERLLLWFLDRQYSDYQADDQQEWQQENHKEYKIFI